MQHRTVLWKLIVVCSLFANASLLTAADGIADQYAGLDSASYLGDLTVVAKVEDQKIFTEGPCCDRSGNVFFTNTEASKILKWDGRQLSVFRQDQNAANGLLI